MIKRLLRWGVLGIALLALFVGATWVVSLPMMRGAEAFFRAGSEEDFAAAWARLTPAAQAEAPPPSLAAIFHGNRWLAPLELRWSAWELRRGAGRLEGRLRSKEGIGADLEVRLEKSGDRWLVAGFTWTLDRVVTPAAPPPGAVETLLRSSVEALALALESDDFRTFHAQIAAPWALQQDADELAAAFAPLAAGAGYLLAAARTGPLVLDQAPGVDEGHQLGVSGYLDVPGRIRVDAAYVLEDDAWRLISLHVNIAASPAGEADAPPGDRAS